ncbi:OsmC family protein [Peribacillus saganii]|nr:OsmC family protein [Peribacillus saganii]
MANMKVNVNAVWNDGVKGNGTLNANFHETKIAIPASIEGSGDGANPKEVLVSSVTTCYTATLVFVLESKKLKLRIIHILFYLLMQLKNRSNQDKELQKRHGVRFEM